MRDLKKRVMAMEQRQQRAGTVFLVHRPTTPDGGCLDCPLPGGAHFTIDIDAASGREGDAT